jgi:hypothetical protein
MRGYRRPWTGERVAMWVCGACVCVLLVLSTVYISIEIVKEIVAAL